VKKEELENLYDSKDEIFTPLDIHFARFMERLCGGDAPELSLAAALVSSYTRKGHICLDLSSMAGKPLLETMKEGNSIVCPQLNHWCGRLRESMVVGTPGQYKPLILNDRCRLYLFRYWDYQQKLTDFIKRHVREDGEDIHISSMKERLKRLFPTNEPEEMDWQKVAAVTAAMKPFCVVSGGPGTGKTTTVAKILALLLELADPEILRITLAAPTGKAAARLQETLMRAKETLHCQDQIKEAIPEEASTIHRLLGSIPGSPYFRHDKNNRLPVDVVVVDEASMVDLALLSKLIQALPSHARLILLGDKDQLASVEAGAVLGDICNTGNTHSYSRRFCMDLKKITGYEIMSNPDGDDASDIQDCIVQLPKSYRFVRDSGIDAVSRAVNAGNGDLAISLLKEDRSAGVEWKDLPRAKALAQDMRDKIIQGFGNYLRANEPRQIFYLFEQFRILCAVREGPYGVAAINFLVEQILKEEKIIEPEKRWYRGRPVLITTNDYNLRLFNGDMGIVLPDPEEDNDLRTFFPAADGTLRKFHPLRLPEHETVYAMTVHKSQGSEFASVLLVLPDRESPVLTRELIYTGITRAKESVEVWGTEDVFRLAISRSIERSSGLRDALWQC